MKKDDKVILNMSRTQYPDKDRIEFQIISAETEELIRVSISMEDFAKAITGDMYVPAEVIRYKEPK